MFDKILALIAPHSCSGCALIGSPLCEHCIDDIISEPYLLCIRCLRPVADDNLCRVCRQRVMYQAAWVVGSRELVLRDLIDKYKFERLMAADKSLVRLLDERIPVLPPETIVTYIPTISSHIRQRGYDHMERLAKKLASERQLKSIPLLERTSQLVQRGADRKTRLAQQQGVFVAKDVVIDAPILLLDDIYTTGGTVDAAVTALSSLTIPTEQPIYVAVLARQPRGK